jgi:hypothetical protein
MKIVDRRYLIVDAEKQRILMVGNLVLRGQCKRCGACCPNECEKKRDGFCEGYYERPYKCWLYPMPCDVKEGCGFRYEDVVGE